MWMDSHENASLRVMVPSGITPGAPVSVFTSSAQYRMLTRERTAALLCSLEQYIGRKTTDEWLSSLFRRHCFESMDRADFEQELAKVSGYDLSGLISDYLDTEIMN